MRMASIDSSSLANGLPVHRIAVPGTRALTVLVAFDAGARTERPEENGMAHFLEHLVFKGGEAYPTYRDVNESAERIGAQLNAYTSHDLVAFHITARAERAAEAIVAFRERRWSGRRGGGFRVGTPAPLPADLGDKFARFPDLRAPDPAE